MLQGLNLLQKTEMPTAVEITVFKEFPLEGKLPSYNLRGIFGPLRLQEIRVVRKKDDFVGSNGVSYPAYDVHEPSVEQKGTLNEKTGKPYRNRFFQAEDNSRKLFVELCRDAVKAAEAAGGADGMAPGTVYEHKSDKPWSHAAGRVSVQSAFIPLDYIARRISYSVLPEGLQYGRSKYAAVSTISFAGFQIKGVFVKEKSVVTQVDGKRVERKFNGEKTLEGFYLNFPQYSTPDKSAGAAPGDRRFFDYVSPLNGEIRTMLSEAVIHEIMGTDYSDESLNSVVKYVTADNADAVNKMVADTTMAEFGKLVDPMVEEGKAKVAELNK